MTRAEYRQNQEFRGERAEDEIPFGSHYANALAFIVDTLADDDELPVQNTSDFENALDPDTIMEFAEMYNFTIPAFRQAMEAFQRAVITETTNPHWQG